MENPPVLCNKPLGQLCTRCLVCLRLSWRYWERSHHSAGTLARLVMSEVRDSFQARPHIPTPVLASVEKRAAPDRGMGQVSGECELFSLQGD